jgi:Domain of unknown function (DUF4145)
VKPQHETLSKSLLAQAEKYATYPIRLPKDPELRERCRNLVAMGKKLVSSREWFDPAPEQLYPSTLSPKQEAGLRTWLDDHYTRELLKRVPRYVKRTMQLSRLYASRPPSERTNLYLREATRTYVLGLWNASIALCRAALESALRDKLPDSTPSWRLPQLLNGARAAGILGPVEADMAGRVKVFGDTVLHSVRGEAPAALAALTAARAVLEKLHE